MGHALRSARVRDRFNGFCAAGLFAVATALLFAALGSSAQGASVLTQHNDNRRTGANLQEAALTPAALTPQHFGKLMELRIDPPQAGGPDKWDSQVVAQPLVASGVAWGDGTTKDVLVVCTMHGTVYAYDVGNLYKQLWARWLGQPVKDLGADEGNINDLKDIFKTNPEWGILSTPVIDAGRRRLYVTHWGADEGGTHRLYALDLRTGQDVLPPAKIRGAVKKANGQDLAFNPVLHKQRPALLLLRPEDVPAARQADVGPEGSVYVAFGASIEGKEDQFKYYGWLFAYDAKTLGHPASPGPDPQAAAPRAVWCSTPNGIGAGIWQAGQGPSSDGEGNLYLMTGNGSPPPATGNYGQSFVKLNCKDLAVLDFFSPWDRDQLNVGDNDLGSAGPVCADVGGGKTFIIGGGKPGRLYSLNPAAMGGPGDTATHKNNVVDEVQATGNPPGHHHEPGDPHDDAHAGHHHIHGSPVFFAPPGGPRIYVWGENDVLRAFPLDANGKFGQPVFAHVVAPHGMPGGMLSASANGTADGIVWAAVPLNGDANKQRLVPGVLRAFDATTLQQIWHSDRPGDHLGHFAKFAPPTVANGRVYVATYDGKLVIYGPK